MQDRSALTAERGELRVDVERVQVSVEPVQRRLVLAGGVGEGDVRRALGYLRTRPGEVRASPAAEPASAADEQGLPYEGHLLAGFVRYVNCGEAR